MYIIDIVVYVFYCSVFVVCVCAIYFLFVVNIFFSMLNLQIRNTIDYLQSCWTLITLGNIKHG